MMEPGQKVICIDDKFLPEIAALFSVLPKKDVVYVIRDVLLGVHHPGNEGDVRLLLVGLSNPCPNGKASSERGFSVNRFRLLEELKLKASQPKVEKKQVEVQFL